MSDVGIGLLLFVCLLIAVGVIRFFSWLTELQEQHGSVGRAGVHAVQKYVSVKRSQNVMSRYQNTTTEDVPSSHRQTVPQTDRQPIPREVMLDMYRLLREHNVPREKARPVLKAAGIPLDNNLWTDAAPLTEDAGNITPIAGRRTNAVFETDPDLMYRPPS